MSELLIVERELPPDVLERSGDGWTVSGVIVPLGRVQEVSDDGVTRYREMFDPDAFDRDISNGGRWINLMIGHQGYQGDRFLGRCTGLRKTDGDLWGEFRLDRSHPRADEARNGELVKWSVGAKVFDVKHEGLVRRYTRAGVDHVAATPRPQYADAGVVMVREETTTVTGTPGTPRRDAAVGRLSALRSAVESRHPGT